MQSESTVSSPRCPDGGCAVVTPVEVRYYAGQAVRAGEAWGYGEGDQSRTQDQACLAQAGPLRGALRALATQLDIDVADAAAMVRQYGPELLSAQGIA